MNEKENPSNQTQPDGPHLDKEIIKKIVENQTQLAKNEASKIQLHAKEIDHNAEIAKRTLELQGKYLMQAGTEKRKTIQLYSVFIGLFLAAFLIFFFSCLYFGFQDFALKSLAVVSHLLTLIIGYYFGKRNNKDSSKEDNIDDAEIIED